MSKITSIFVAALAAFASRADAVEVASCAEFAAVDRRVETEVTITNPDIACDQYTRLSIRTPMVLKSTVGKVHFSNFALKVYESLTVEPDVVFTGVTKVTKNGGALKVELDAECIFQGTAEFADNWIIATDIDKATEEEQLHKGGAIHNKGKLTFEKDATFTGNVNDSLYNGSGPGGAISVHVKGSVHFMGKLTMDGNIADDYWGGAEGGAIYNKGDIVVEGEAIFNMNVAGRGGAIFQQKWATFVFNDFASFTSNRCLDTYGGAVANIGGDLTFNAGSLFDGSVADNSGDGGNGGAIFSYNGGVITFAGSTTFSNNVARWGGAIFNSNIENPWYPVEDYKIPVITYPDDTVFSGNMAEFCDDFAADFDEETCGIA